jgi:hypothetical protein
MRLTKVIALLLAVGRAGRSGAGMRFIDDHQFRALLDENIAPGVGLDEVDADDLDRVVVVDAGIALNLAIQSRLGVGADDDGFDIQLGANFGLPLLAQMRQADDGEALDLAPLQQFLDDQQGFNRLADTDVIGDQTGAPTPAAAP